MLGLISCMWWSQCFIFLPPFQKILHLILMNNFFQQHFPTICRSEWTPPSNSSHTIGSKINTTFEYKVVPCYRRFTLPQCYRRNELEKKWAYEERVGEIDFSAAGGKGTIATVMYRNKEDHTTRHCTGLDAD